MCNPAGHPAGGYGKAALESLGPWAEISSKIAIVDNPQVAVAMVARGDAPAATVFATEVKDIAGAGSSASCRGRAIRSPRVCARLDQAGYH
jgi:molybdate transport system substrate-binding protein